MEPIIEIPDSPTRIAMRGGVFTATLMLIFSALGWQLMSWLAFIFGIYMGMKAYKSVRGGIIIYSQALSAGFQTAFFTSFILAFFAYVSVTINPSGIDITLEAMEQQLKTYTLSPVIAESIVQQWREILSPVMVAAITIFAYSAAGGLVAVLLAFFVKNTKSGEFVEY